MAEAAEGGALTSAAPSRGWIQSPSFDMAAFILVPLSSLVVLGAVLGWPYGTPIVVAATYLVGIPHYMSSLTFFLGDDNFAYYRTRWVAFFVGPIVILAGVVLFRSIGYDAIVLNAMFTWNIWHVSLQSSGILSIYRRLNGGPHTERPVAQRAILFWNATLALWFIERYPPLHGWLTFVHPSFPALLRVALLGAALFYLARLAVSITRRPHGLSLPEGTFLASSLVLFLPYLWVRDSNLATFGMLMGHFIQYLSIVWLLQHRKYSGGGGSPRQRALGRMSAKPVFVGGTIVATGLAFYLANELSIRFGAPMAYIVLWNALTLVHFYLDGLIWAFKTPFVRQSIGPHLTPASRIVQLD